jgi:hypothetical protein
MLVVLRTMYILGGFLILGALVAHIYARVKLRPRNESDLDEVYYEFEDQDPEYARYSRWLKATTAMGALGMLLMFAAVAL